MAAEQELRARAAEDALTGAIERYLDRARGVVTARLSGPRARKHTRFWEARGETKAVATRPLDPGYIVPDNLADGLADDLHTVSLRVATDSAKSTQLRLGGQGLSEVDMDDIGQAITNAVERLLGVAARHSEEIKNAILEADSTAQSLDEVLNRVEAAHQRGGNWLRLGGNTLAHALANESAYRTALAAGCTHRQWISRRDPAVRATHVLADGQVRPMGEKFRVGRFELLYPGDPAELPASWGEIANCRCGQLFSGNSEQAQRESALLNAQIASPAAAQRAAVTVNAAAANQPQPDPVTPGTTPAAVQVPADLLESAPAAVQVPADLLESAPRENAVSTPSVIRLPAPVGAYRALAAPVGAVSGQVLKMDPATPLTLSLSAPPAVAGGLLLAILLPAGVQALVGAAGLILPAGAALEVLAVTAEQIQARYLDPATQPPPPAG